MRTLAFSFDRRTHGPEKFRSMATADFFNRTCHKRTFIPDQDEKTDNLRVSAKGKPPPWIEEQRSEIHTCTFQMLCAYSRIVRSLEKMPMPATLMMAFRVHSSGRR
jgi:hypothetical protein